MTLCQCDYLRTLAEKTRIIADEYGADLSSDKLRKGGFEVIQVARVGDFQRPPGGTGNFLDLLLQVLVVRVYQETYGRVWRERVPGSVQAV